MAVDPQYVRLAERLQNGCLADLKGRSGWTISGRDVQPFPTTMEAKSFVRTSLRQGKLEAASLAEYEDVRSGDGTHEPDSVGHQEHLVREAARSGAPYISPDTEETIAKIASDGAEEQEEAPEEGEEQEEQQEEEQPPPPPAKKAPAKKKAAAKKASAKKAAAKKKS